MIETKKRSLAKSIVWRILGIVIMPPIIYYSSKISSNIAETALFSTLIFHSIRIVMYYYHERMWLKIKWGMEPIK